MLRSLFRGVKDFLAVKKRDISVIEKKMPGVVDGTRLSVREARLQAVRVIEKQRTWEEPLWFQS